MILARTWFAKMGIWRLFLDETDGTYGVSAISPTTRGRIGITGLKTEAEAFAWARNTRWQDAQELPL